MITIDLLKNHPQTIPTLAHIWHEVLGKIWMPEVSFVEIESLYHQELHQDMPVTYVAFDDHIPVGSCTIELEGGIRPDLGPWLGDLVVAPKHQKQGIGKRLVNAAIGKVKQLGFTKLFLFTFDSKTANYYERLGWRHIGKDEFKSRPVTVMEIPL